MKPSIFCKKTTNDTNNCCEDSLSFSRLPKGFYRNVSITLNCESSLLSSLLVSHRIAALVLHSVQNAQNASRQPKYTR